MNPALPTETRTIGKHTYTVTRLGFANSRKLLELSEKVLGPAILQLASAAKEGMSVADLLAYEAGPAIEAILGVLGRLGSSQSDEIFRLLGEATHATEDGRVEYLTPQIQDQWWALYPGECLPWLAFCYEVQYRDFFAEGVRGLGRRGQPGGAQ